MYSDDKDNKIRKSNVIATFFIFIFIFITISICISIGLSLGTLIAQHG